MHSENLRILFVGDEKVEGLQHVGIGADDWKIDFSETPKDAMQRMQSEPFDIVVADLKMQMGDQVSLLEVVKDEFPQTVRILLTEDSSARNALDLITVAHQQLAQPFDLKSLEFVVGRAMALRDLVDDAALRYVLANVTALPNIPALYTQITDELNSDDPSMRVVGELVTQDIGMAAKVLQVANSVVMGARAEIVDPMQATVQMGSDMVRSLVLGTKVFEQFEEGTLDPATVQQLLDHSMRVGTYAQKICRQERTASDVAEAAFTAGLLHDVGKLILATNLPDSYNQCAALAAERGIPLCLAEKEVLGSTHAEVGAYLIGLWGLPDRIFATMLDHHSPQQSPERDFGALTAVHVANAFDHHYPGSEGSEQYVDLAYVEAVQAMDRIPQWRDLCVGDADD